jgi:hypothetical protein
VEVEPNEEERNKEEGGEDLEVHRGGVGVNNNNFLGYLRFKW